MSTILYVFLSCKNRIQKRFKVKLLRWTDIISFVNSYLHFIWPLWLHELPGKLSLPPMVLLHVHACFCSRSTLSTLPHMVKMRLSEKLSSLSSVRMTYACFMMESASLFLRCLSPGYALILPVIHWNANCKWNRWQPVILTDSSGRWGTKGWVDLHRH